MRLLLKAACCAALAIAVQVPCAAQTFNNFITRQGDKLYDGSSEFRFISVHLSTVHRNENDLLDGRPDIWPTDFEIEDQLSTVSQIGGLATRTYTLSVRRQGIDVDWHINDIGQYSEQGLRVLDKIIATAERYNIRLIIPIIDSYEYELWGGHTDFARLSGAPPQDFFVNRQAIDQFKLLITDLVNRTNTITGRKYKDEKAILAWQLGNELNAIRGLTNSWTAEIAAHFKSVDPNHLVADGRDEDFDSALNDPNIDIVDAHFYGLWDRTTDLVTPLRRNRDLSRGKKALIVGEFGYAPFDSVRALLDEMAADGTSGALLWTLRGHHRAGGFRSEDGEYSSGYRAFHWPGFSTSDDIEERQILTLLQSRAFAIRGLTVPPVQPPAPPLMLMPEDTASISWMGSVGAESYTVERSSSLTGPWTTVASGIRDDRVGPLFKDPSAQPGQSYYYRVSAQNSAGSSAATDVAGPVPAAGTLVDELSDWNKTYSNSGLGLDSTNGSYFGGDLSRAYRLQATGNEQVVWNTPNLLSWEAETYHWPGEIIRDLEVSVSTDASSWRVVQPKTLSRKHRNDWWTKRIYSFNARGDVNFVRVRWADGGGQVWNPQLGRVIFSGSTTQHDELLAWDKAQSRTAGLIIDYTNRQLLGEDNARAARRDRGPQEIVWQRDNMREVALAAYFWPNEAISDFTILFSQDGATWSSAAVTSSDETYNDGRWTRRTYVARPTGTAKFVKVQWNNSTGQVWSPQIGRVALRQ